MRVVIYSRVSTDAQERDGTSLDTQERECLKFAEANGWSVVGTIRDAASGFTLERPGMTEVRNLAARGLVDVVLYYALDRLSRKQTQVGILVEEMEEHGVALDFVTEKFEDTATGQLLRSVKAFAAEFEREKTAERTMRGKAERARSGRLPQAAGRGVYGYVYEKTSGKRRITPDKASVVRRLFEEFASGASIVGLSNALNDEFIPTMQGKAWAPATIFHMLRNSGYAGQTTYRRLKTTRMKDPLTGKKKRRVTLRPQEEWIEVPDATPAIVPAAYFEAVQRRLDDPERLRHGRRLSTYGLAGRIKCSRCGSAMIGQTLQGRYRYYRCRRAFAGPKHDRCDSLYVRADKLESRLLEEIGRTLSEPSVILRELIRLNERPKGGADQEGIRERLESIERQRAPAAPLPTRRGR
jgi:site-specific DNA recombinase